MNGATALINTLADCGVEFCIANPGTSEMHLVQALDAVPRMKSVLALFEGVCTGAADGVGRMTGKPAATRLHLGPGMANGIANLHNAQCASSPILNVIGTMATWHAAADAPLKMDVGALTQTGACWTGSTRTSTASRPWRCPPPPSSRRPAHPSAAPRRPTRGTRYQSSWKWCRAKRTWSAAARSATRAPGQRR